MRIVDTSHGVPPTRSTIQSISRKIRAAHVRHPAKKFTTPSPRLLTAPVCISVTPPCHNIPRCKFTMRLRPVRLLPTHQQERRHYPRTTGPCQWVDRKKCDDLQRARHGCAVCCISEQPPGCPTPYKPASSKKRLGVQRGYAHSFTGTGHVRMTHAP